MNTKEVITAAACLLIILGSGVWIYKTQVKAPEINTALHRGVGERLATETVRALDGQGTVLIVNLEAGVSDILDAQEEAFRQTLRSTSQVMLTDAERVKPEKGDTKYGPGSGLSARRLARLIEKNKQVDALVSFLGLPETKDGKGDAFGPKRPKLLAVTRSPKKLVSLMEGGAVAAAIVPRFEFPAPGTNAPRTPAEWFDTRFQVLRPKSAADALKP